MQRAAVNTEPGLTRAELIAELAASSPHLRQVEAERIVATIFDQITAALAASASSCVFGAFTVKQRSSRMGTILAPARWLQWGRRRGRSSSPARKCSAGSMAAAGPRQIIRRNRGTSGIRFTAARSGSGFQLAMVRAHSRAWALSVSARETVVVVRAAAANSPRCSKTARIAAASASVTTNIAGAWGEASACWLD